MHLQYSDSEGSDLFGEEDEEKSKSELSESEEEEEEEEEPSAKVSVLVVVRQGEVWFEKKWEILEKWNCEL